MNALALAAQVLRHVAEQPYAADVARVWCSLEFNHITVMFAKLPLLPGNVVSELRIDLVRVACVHVHCGWQDELTCAHQTWLRELQPKLKDDPQQLCANARAMLPRRS